MENFLSGRPAVAKLNFAAKKPPTGAFTPLFEKSAEPAARLTTPTNGNAMPTGTTHPGVLPPEPAHGHSVQVEVSRVEGVVQGITVTCKCGERIELDCVY